MSNEVLTPEQNVTPVVPVVAPVVAPIVGPMPAVVASIAVHKPTHKMLYALLTVFLVMGGALAAVGFLKPDLITSTIAWVTKTPIMHAASPESRVLVNGEWVDSSNPAVELAKVKKPVAPIAEEKKVEVPAAPEAPVSPVDIEAPAKEPVTEPAKDAAPAEATEKKDAPAFDLGDAQKEVAPEVPAVTEPAPLGDVIPQK